MGFPGDSVVKNLAAIQDIWIWDGGLNFWVGKIEKEMATQSSILAWEIPWIEKPGRLQSGGQNSQTQFSNKTITTRGKIFGQPRQVLLTYMIKRRNG